jgi:hypothetical protein
MKSDNSLGYGVYYSLDDYAGMGQRVAVMLIDSIVLVVMGVLQWIHIFLLSNAVGGVATSRSELGVNQAARDRSTVTFSKDPRSSKWERTSGRCHWRSMLS